MDLESVFKELKESAEIVDEDKIKGMIRNFYEKGEKFLCQNRYGSNRT